NFQLAHLQLGDIYRRIKNLEKAKEHYRKAVKILPLTSYNIYYTLGEIELHTGDYPRAKKSLETFLDNSPDVEQKYTDRAKKYIKDCDFAIEAVKNPLPYEP